MGPKSPNFFPCPKIPFFSLKGFFQAMDGDNDGVVTFGLLQVGAPFGAFWGFWGHFGTFWDIWATSGAFGDSFRVIWGSFWRQFWDHLGPFGGGLRPLRDH